MADLEPRRIPRQARSRANLDALLDATAHLLRERGYAALTTNHIAARAGVSIGTLYQLFPGKEAVVAALVERTARKRLETIVNDLPAALAQSTPGAALDLLVRRIAKMLAADRRLYAVLLREVPFLQNLTIVRETVDALISLTAAQLAPLRAGVAGKDSEVETWLLGRMAYEALVAVAVFREGPDPDRSLDAFIRLLTRLLPRSSVPGAPRA
jgi:AcrR family transcriptional regulator